jgi:GNAT superfamily N-acetyltransferase
MAKTEAKAVIRPAGPEDVDTILRMIRELAAYEGLLDQVRARESDLLRDGFGPAPHFRCLLLEVDGEAVGFAMFFHTYSTFEGRPGLYVEDIYIAERARARNLGRLLMARLAALALEAGCARLDLSVLRDNPARGFYHRLGLAEVADWLPYRLEGEALKRLAESQGRHAAAGA